MSLNKEKVTKAKDAVFEAAKYDFCGTEMLCDIWFEHGQAILWALIYATNHFDFGEEPPTEEGKD